VFSSITTVYAFLWDVVFDWGLLRFDSRNAWLRDEISYPALYYYCAVVINAFLRISWILLLAPGYWDALIPWPIAVYVLAVFEVVRFVELIQESHLGSSAN
jgi:hypothetical protein